MARSTAIPVLLLVLASVARPAEDLAGAAREVARQAARFAGSREVVTVSYRNLTPVGNGETAAVVRAVDDALAGVGIKTGTGGTVELRVTHSENLSQFLLVGEARRGDERAVWMAAWPRTAGDGGAGESNLRLDGQRLFEQTEPILDLATPEDALLVLSPGKLTRYSRQNGGWEAKESATISRARPWPRDPRGKLRVTGGTLRIATAGVACSGTWQPQMRLDCQPGDEAWVLESGRQAMLVATFAAERNYFDGRVTAQDGARRTLQPFYTAAEVGGHWLVAGVDGRTVIYDAQFAPEGTVANWGSDIAGTSAKCGQGQQVLATRAGEENEAVQAFTLVNRQVEALSLPLAMPGPVTALWPEGASAIAVVHLNSDGRYAAYRLTLACGS